MFHSSYIFFKFFILIVPVLLSVAFITLLERKILGLVGLRLGPNKISFFGILQPLMDALKLSNKQVNMLSNFSFFFYYISSLFMLLSALMLWSSLYSEPSPLSLKFSVIIILIFLSFNSLNSIISGWSTFGKFSLIGSVRTVAQLISYEAVLYLIIFFIIFFYSCFNFFNFNFFPNFFVCFCFPICFYIWLPSILAELNRTPYDFSEGESELVSGFNTEFGSGSFTLIFLAEYSNIIFLSLVTSFFFFWGFLFYFFFFIMFFIIWIRSVLPRFRFDKLMILAWKFFVPFMTFFFLVSVCFLS